jgi:hypothetical protein
MLLNKDPSERETPRIVVHTDDKPRPDSDPIHDSANVEVPALRLEQPSCAPLEIHAASLPFEPEVHILAFVDSGEWICLESATQDAQR